MKPIAGPNLLPPPIEPLEIRVAPAATVIDLATLDGTDGIKLNGLAAGDAAGAAATLTADFNGDSFPDLVIAAPDADSNGVGSGSVYVVFGTSRGIPTDVDLDNLDGTNGFAILGEGPGDAAGFSVSAGDLSGDGLSDLIIGAPYASNSAGAVYVVYGRSGPFGFPATFTLTADQGINKFIGEGQGEAAGFSVSTAGDFDHDGRDDFLIGAPNAPGSGGGEGFGAAYLIFGRPYLSYANPFSLASDLNFSSGFKVKGLASQDFLGVHVSNAGDLNNDDFDDIVIGANQADSAQQDSGAAFVIFGGASVSGPFPLTSLDGTNGFRVDGEALDDQAGFRAGAAGDINGDTFDDLAVVAPFADPNGADSGAVYVIYGKPGGFAATLNLSSVSNPVGFKIQGEAAGDAAGTSLGTGDFNGDGVADLMIGAAGTTSRTGSGYVVFGSITGFPDVFNLSQLNGSNGIKLLGAGEDDFTGCSISSGVDLNGDGFDDLLIGARGADPNGESSGSAYLVYGFDSRLNITGGGQTVTITEADGDIVTLKLSQGGLTAGDIVLAPDGTIRSLDLTSLAAPAAIGGQIRPLNISIAVKTQVGGAGDGLTKVGLLNASGVAIGKLKLEGDLGRLIAGSATGGMAAKNIRILGNFGSLGSLIPSQLGGDLGKLLVKGNVQNSLDVDGKIKAITIGGDYLGDPSAPALRAEEFANAPGEQAEQLPTAAGILRAASIGKLKIAGSLKNGAIAATKSLGVVSITGDLYRGNLFGGEGIKAVKVLGRVSSDDPNTPATITARNKLGSIVINGDVENARILVGYNDNEEPVNPDATAGKILVKGNWIASSLAVGIVDSTDDGFGRNDVVISGDTTSAVSKIASVVIKGTASGSSAPGDHFGITAQQIGKVSIDGALVPLTDLLDDILVDATNNDFRIVEIG